MKYFIITTKEDTIAITEEEHQKLKGRSGVVFIPSLGEMINLSFIYRIIPETKFLDYLKSRRGKSANGVLHDGTRVIKQFGQWVDAKNPDVKFNAEYYPEIIKDGVMSEEEYEYIKNKPAIELPATKQLGDVA